MSKYSALQPWYILNQHVSLLFSARCNIYISRLCYDVSVRLSVHLSVTEVHWRIIANLGFKFRSKFTAHSGHSPQCARMHYESQCMRACTASRSACGRIVVVVHAGKRGGFISHYASHCYALCYAMLRENNNAELAKPTETNGPKLRLLGHFVRKSTAKATRFQTSDSLN